MRRLKDVMTVIQQTVTHIRKLSQIQQKLPQMNIVHCYQKKLEKMDDILEAKPFMSPVATTSSTGKKTLLECSTFDNTVNDEKQPQKKKRRTYSECLVKELKEKEKRRKNKARTNYGNA